MAYNYKSFLILALAAFFLLAADKSALAVFIVVLGLIYAYFRNRR